MALDRLNPALKWFAAICLAGFIFSGCLRYLLPHDFHSSGNALVKPAVVPPGSPSKSPPSRSPTVAAPAPVSLPPVSLPPAAQQATTLQPADTGLLPPQPDQPPANAFPSQPPPAAPSRPTEKVSACVIGDPELRDLFATKLPQSIPGKIVSGYCSAVEGPIVMVSGFASKFATNDPACKTVDGHLYEVIFSISRPGSHSDISRTVSAARCSSRIRHEDTALGREAKNQAVLLGIISLRDLLQHLSEN
jgi:hypothetical protein